jgi:hypothetical protein
MYKKTNNTYIIRIADNACIPDDPKNSEYKEYLAWVNAGNTADPIDPKSQEDIDYEEKVNKNKIEKGKATSDAVVKYLIEHTAEEIDTYVRSNITTLADAKNIIAKLAVVVGVALRE